MHFNPITKIGKETGSLDKIKTFRNMIEESTGLIFLSGLSIYYDRNDGHCTGIQLDVINITWFLGKLHIVFPDFMNI